MSRILIVEDEVELAEAYTAILEHDNHKVMTALDGKEALRLAESYKPNLILLDLLMPNMDGLEFLEEYNAPENHPAVKIIIYSNLDMREKADQAFSLGAHKYILKAWASPHGLQNIVREQLSSNKVTS